MRWYVGEGDYKVETIATADDSADADGIAALDFRQAQALIRERFVEYTRVAQGLPAKDGPFTIRACLDDYLVFLETNRKSGKDARWRAEALILPVLGDIACADLTAPKLRRWLEDVANKAPRLRTRTGAEQRYREIDGEDEDGERRRRRRASANRVLTILKAALNRAWREGKIVSDEAWRRVEPFEEADAARVRYLTIDECRRLIDSAGDEFRDLVEAALLTGCRFGELAAIPVRDFNPDAGTLHIRTSKTGKGRHVVLNDEGIALFRRLSESRPGGELMLRKADGYRWGKSNQTRPMAEACTRAKIEPPANFHCLRHTYASHATMAGALLVVAKNLGHADTRMVEKHYGHLSEGNYIDDSPPTTVVERRTVGMPVPTALRPRNPWSHRGRNSQFSWAHGSRPMKKRGAYGQSPAAATEAATPAAARCARLGAATTTAAATAADSNTTADDPA
jgi:integrase